MYWIYALCSIIIIVIYPIWMATEVEIEMRQPNSCDWWRRRRRRQRRRDMRVCDSLFVDLLFSWFKKNNQQSYAARSFNAFQSFDKRNITFSRINHSIRFVRWNCFESLEFTLSFCSDIHSHAHRQASPLTTIQCSTIETNRTPIWH